MKHGNILQSNEIPWMLVVVINYQSQIDVSYAIDFHTVGTFWQQHKSFVYSVTKDAIVHRCGPAAFDPRVRERDFVRS